MRSTSKASGSTEKYKAIVKIFLVLFLVLCLVFCWKIGRKLEDRDKFTEIPEIEEEFETIFPYLTPTELDMKTEMTDAITVDLSKYDSDCEITEGGNYRLIGELNGTLHIYATEQNVHLFLENAKIESVKGPAIYCEKADKLVITSTAGTENVISDSGRYQADAEVEACIYSTCDMTLNGSGKLTVNGLYRDAVRSRDIVKILDGEYEIKCKNTGIRGNDGIYISGGNITVYSEKNGLKTTKTGDDGHGNLVVGGGNINIVAGRYSFVSEKASLYVYNCHVLSRSVVDTYQVGGTAHIREGCIEQ